MTKNIDVLDIQELMWVVPMELISENQIIQELQQANSNYSFISIEEDHTSGHFVVNLLVLSAFIFDTVEDLITDCQYELAFLFDKFTIQNSMILPLVDGDIYDIDF